MSSVPIGTIAFFLSIVLFAAAVSAEIAWLVRRDSATFGRAVGYVLTSDLVAICLSSVIFIVSFAVMFMIVMGPAGRGSDAPETVYFAISGATLFLSSLILFFSKRIFLALFKMRSGGPAWVYSAISTIWFIAVAVIPPPVVYLAFSYAAAS